MQDGKQPDASDLRQVERDRTISRRFEVDKTIDRTTITIASGAIALSVTILEKGGLNSALSLYSLYTSWMLLVLCILAVLWSMNESRKALFSYVELIDSGEESARQRMDLSAGRTDIANKVAMVLLVIGLGAMLLAFGSAFRGDSMGNTRRLDEGFVVQPNGRAILDRREPAGVPANRGHQPQANPAVVGQGGAGASQQSGAGAPSQAATPQPNNAGGADNK